MLHLAKLDQIKWRLPQRDQGNPLSVPSKSDSNRCIVTTQFNQTQELPEFWSNDDLMLRLGSNHVSEYFLGFALDLVQKTILGKLLGKDLTG